jgi:hypothetical protein
MLPEDFDDIDVLFVFFYKKPPKKTRRTNVQL